MNQNKYPYIVIPFYAVTAFFIIYLMLKSGTYPGGADTMFYVYRGDLLYRSVKEQGNWYPLLDLQWYNGVQTLRHWSPLPAYILAGCQALAGGNTFDGFLLFVGLLYFCSAMVWLHIGYTHNRPWLGAFLGALWFFIPNNLFMLYTEGVIARSIAVVILPLYVVYVHDYFATGDWKYLLKMIPCFLFITMCHSGWAGMLLITLLIYLLFYRIVTPKAERGSSINVIIIAVISFLLSGIWLYASLKGGITSTDSSEIMRSYFQSLNNTLNPFYGISLDTTRWANGTGTAYFGFAAFLLASFGILLGNRRSIPGFCTAISVCLLTSSAAYPLLVLLPGSQYLWMLRFLSIALTFLLVSFFFWNTLKRGLVILFCFLLLVDALPATQLINMYNTGISPDARYTSHAKETLIDQARAITKQRVALPEPQGSVIDGIYLIAGYGGNEAVPTSYGAGVQAAATYTNVVQLNQATEDGKYFYLFDRSLELGNDTILLSIQELQEGKDDIELVDQAATASGYDLVASNQQFRLYHLSDAVLPDTNAFGLQTNYRAIGIGSFAPQLSLSFPAIEEADSICLTDYTFNELSNYDVIYLAGFTYSNKEKAESLILRLSEAGTRIVILADGIPVDSYSGVQEFLGVNCHTISFSNGYPEFDTVIGPIFGDLFLDGYSQWNTVYLNGLTECWGSFTDSDQELMFCGTVKNNNIVMLGLNLVHHYALTGDAAIGDFLSYLLTLSPTDLPERIIVPLTITQNTNTITIISEYDNVNTTLAFHDIFNSKQSITEKNHLTYVNAGTTIVEMNYPYLLEGSLLSAFALICAVFFLCFVAKKERDAKAVIYQADSLADIQPADQTELAASSEITPTPASSYLVGDDWDTWIQKQKSKDTTLTRKGNDLP